MNGTFVKGSVAPNAISDVVQNGSAVTAFVGTAIVSASYLAIKPDGTPQTWACTLSGATATQVTVTHLFAVGELDQAGEYRARISLQGPSGGPMYTEREIIFIVEDE